MRLPALLAPLLLLAGCVASDAPAPPQDAAVPDAGAAPGPAAGPAPAAVAPEGSDPATPRVLAQAGAFLVGMGDPSALLIGTAPQVRFPADAPFSFEVQEGETALVVDFYHRAAGGLAMRATDPEGRSTYGLSSDTDTDPLDPEAIRHVHVRIDATPGTWTLEPHVFKVRVDARYVFVASLFNSEPPADYFAPMPE